MQLGGLFHHFIVMLDTFNGCNKHQAEYTSENHCHHHLLILLFGVFLKKCLYYKEPQFKDQLLFYRIVFIVKTAMPTKTTAITPAQNRLAIAIGAAIRETTGTPSRAAPKRIIMVSINFIILFIFFISFGSGCSLTF